MWQDFTLDECIGTWIPWDQKKKVVGVIYCHAGRSEQFVMKLVRQSEARHQANQTNVWVLPTKQLGKGFPVATHIGTFYNDNC